jgi:glycosyltransferase involved in cell wall biosynthesis
MVRAARELTVVVPMRNEAGVVADALASLLDQEGGPPTVVVVDNGSSDGSAAVVSLVAPDARIVRTEDLRPSGSRNAGVRVATTAFLAFCDADDLWPPDRCRHDLDLLESRPDVPGVLGPVRFEAETPELLDRYRFDGDEPVRRVPHLGALTVRRDAWDRVGPLDETARGYEDHDWFLRADDAGQAPLGHDHLSLVRRLRADGYTAGRRAPARERLAFLHRTVVRRRDG